MVEDDLMLELKTMFIGGVLTKLKEDGKLHDFIEFAREQARKDGMDSDSFMCFLDELDEIAEEEEEDDDAVT